MIREVDLASYLPPHMAKCKELSATLEAENPEFKLVWQAANRILYNGFIATADVQGISRFESILGILPSVEDTLESRRARAQARWFNAMPYTMRAFILKLIALCGENNFIITEQFDCYRLTLKTDLELFGQVEELEHIISTMVPCNMIVNTDNKIPCIAEGTAPAAGGICMVDTHFITNDFKELFNSNGLNAVGSCVIISEQIEAKEN